MANTIQIKNKKIQETAVGHRLEANEKAVTEEPRREDIVESETAGGPTCSRCGATVVCPNCSKTGLMGGVML